VLPENASLDQMLNLRRRAALWSLVIGGGESPLYDFTTLVSPGRWLGIQHFRAVARALVKDIIVITNVKGILNYYFFPSNGSEGENGDVTDIAATLNHYSNARAVYYDDACHHFLSITRITGLHPIPELPAPAEIKAGHEEPSSSFSSSSSSSSSCPPPAVEDEEGNLADKLMSWRAHSSSP
jgi:hypothetical protein